MCLTKEYILDHFPEFIKEKGNAMHETRASLTLWATLPIGLPDYPRVPTPADGEVRADEGHQKTP